MRGQQLSELARSSLSERFDIRYVPLGAEPETATLFLTKGALKALNPVALRSLRSRGHRLLFDVVDEPPPATTAEFADAIVASSMASFEKHSRAFPQVQVVLVNHHVDPRVRARVESRLQSKRFAVGYFGNLVNTVLPGRVASVVKQIQVDTDRQESAWLEQITDFPLHYAIRRHRELDDSKPFLKGFTAAACASNIVVHESDHEALSWVGPDYPYIVRGDVCESSILEVLERAREDYGSVRWHNGLAIMASVATRTADARIVSEVGRLIGG